ncbi:hypothetical protein ACFX1R_027930 [Malus domestica]
MCMYRRCISETIVHATNTAAPPPSAAAGFVILGIGTGLTRRNPCSLQHQCLTMTQSRRSGIPLRYAGSGTAGRLAISWPSTILILQNGIPHHIYLIVKVVGHVRLEGP